MSLYEPDVYHEPGVLHNVETDASRRLERLDDYARMADAYAAVSSEYEALVDQMLASKMALDYWRLPNDQHHTSEPKGRLGRVLMHYIAWRQIGRDIRQLHRLDRAAEDAGR